MKKEYRAFACAAACLVAMPIVVNALAAALAARIGETLDGERRIRASLYFCVNSLLIATIFCLWLLD